MDVGSLSGGCVEAIWRLLGSCLGGVGWLSAGCGESVWRVLEGCLQEAI